MCVAVSVREAEVSGAEIGGEMLRIRHWALGLWHALALVFQSAIP